MAELINMDLFSHLDIKIPEPNKADLKWKKKIDGWVKKITPRTQNKILKELQKSLYFSSHKIWRIAYVCTLRQKNSDFAEILNDKTELSFSTPTPCGNVATYSGWINSKKTREILAACFMPQAGYTLHTHNVSPQGAKKWFYAGCNVQRPEILSRAIAEISKDELTALILQEPELFIENDSCLKNAMEAQKGLEFYKILIEAGACPDSNLGHFIQTATSHADFESVRFFQDLLDEKTGRAAPRIEDASHKKTSSTWSLFDESTLTRTRPKPDGSGALVDYFDFSAQRLTRVQETKETVATLFHENFADISNTPLYREALKAFKAEGGDQSLIQDTDVKAPIKTIRLGVQRA